MGSFSNKRRFVLLGFLNMKIGSWPRKCNWLTQTLSCLCFRFLYEAPPALHNVRALCAHVFKNSDTATSSYTLYTYKMAK